MTRSGNALPALTFAALALAGCGTTASQTQTVTGSGKSSLGHPIASAPTDGKRTSRGTRAASARTKRTRTTVSSADSIAIPAPPSPATPRSRAILQVATRFADAYVQYQIGRDSPAIKRAITDTCTTSFARLLLSQPVSIPSAQQHSLAARPAEVTRVTYTGPASLGPGPPVQIVLARYHTIGHGNIGGQLTIEVTGTADRWRVSNLR